MDRLRSGGAKPRWAVACTSARDTGVAREGSGAASASGFGTTRPASASRLARSCSRSATSASRGALAASARSRALVSAVSHRAASSASRAATSSSRRATSAALRSSSTAAFPWPRMTPTSCSVRSARSRSRPRRPACSARAPARGARRRTCEAPLPDGRVALVEDRQRHSALLQLTLTRLEGGLPVGERFRQRGGLTPAPGDLRLLLDDPARMPLGRTLALSCS